MLVSGANYIENENAILKKATVKQIFIHESCRRVAQTVFLRMKVLFKILCLISPVFCVDIALGQNAIKSKVRETRNEILLEAGGYGLYSVNYCRRIFAGSRFALHAGIGISPTTFVAGTSKLRIPIRLQADYILKRNKLVTGFGITPYLEDYVKGLGGWNGDDIAAFVELGYMFVQNKYVYGLSFTPLIYDNNEFQFSPWGALKVGRRF